jgi:tripartite-type tricarboxylate transporter receptor subunit TctC
MPNLPTIAESGLPGYEASSWYGVLAPAGTPRGSEPNFASEARIVAKFEKLAARALPRQRTAQLRDAVLGMEKLRDAARLAQLMTVRRKK